MIYIAWPIIFIGMFFILSGTIALYRLPDFYTKLHAASAIECCGIPLCLFGLSLLQNSLASFLKILFIMVIIFILNPVSTFALSRASVMFKVNKNGRIK